MMILGFDALQAAVSVQFVQKTNNISTLRVKQGKATLQCSRESTV